MASLIHSHSQFQPLEEVWIGGTYPEHFYQHLSGQHQDVFGQLTEITERDFGRLHDTLQNLGIKVRQPQFDRVDDFMDEFDHLLKPPISPCDFALTMGETLYICPQYPSRYDPYSAALTDYVAAGADVRVIDRSSDDPWAWIVFPSVVRLGQDVLIDYTAMDPARKSAALRVADQLKHQYRVHLSTTGDHSDGVFCPISNGRVITTHYRNHYSNTLPGWDVFHLYETAIDGVGRIPRHCQWFVEGVDYLHFNDTVLSVAQDWLGEPHETVFTVNILVVDEHNLICTGGDDRVFKWFESFGMTAHVVDIESKFFWDAGIHCLTSDIRRRGPKQNYWPDRPLTGVFEIQEW
jgi:hypothetical protein